MKEKRVTPLEMRPIEEINFNDPEIEPEVLAMMGELVLHFWAGVEPEYMVDELNEWAPEETRELTNRVVRDYGTYLQQFSETVLEEALTMIFMREFGVPNWEKYPMGIG